MGRPHGRPLRIHPTINDLKHWCVAAFVSIFIAKTIPLHVDQLVANLDDGLFAAVLSNDQHVLRCILPERNTHSYSLRPRRHELVLKPSVILQTFLKDNRLKILLIYCSAAFCHLFFRDQSEVKWNGPHLGGHITHYTPSVCPKPTFHSRTENIQRSNLEERLLTPGIPGRAISRSSSLRSRSLGTKWKRTAYRVGHCGRIYLLVSSAMAPQLSEPKSRRLWNVGSYATATYDMIR